MASLESLLDLTGNMKIGQRELFDYSPASIFEPGQTTTLMNLPEEIRSLIYFFLIEPQSTRLSSGSTRIDWQSTLIDDLPEDMREEGIQAYRHTGILRPQKADYRPSRFRASFIARRALQWSIRVRVAIRDPFPRSAQWTVILGRTIVLVSGRPTRICLEICQLSLCPGVSILSIPRDHNQYSTTKVRGYGSTYYELESTAVYQSYSRWSIR